MGPFFIMGYQRSGTTILRERLNRYRGVCVPPESSFATWLYQEFGDWRLRDVASDRLSQFIVELQRARKFENWRLDSSALALTITEQGPSNYSELVAAVYLTYCNNWSVGRLRAWGDKNNVHANHLDLILKLFPETRIIHVVRDPREVRASELRLRAKANNHPHAPTISPNNSDFCRKWRRQFQALDNYRVARPEDYLLVKIEDYVLKPTTLEKKLLRFLVGPPPCPEYLGDQYDFRQNPELAYSWKSKAKSDPSPGLLWTDESGLDPRIVSEIETELHFELASLGY